MLSSKLLQLKIECYLSFNELAFKTRSFKDSKLKINWWQLSWRNSLIRFYTVFTSRNTKTAACIKNEHYAIGRKNKNKTCVMFIKILSNEMCILHLSQAILNTGWEIYKLLQDPMSHYGSLSRIFKRHNRTFVLHIQTDTFFWLRWIDLSQKWPRSEDHKKIPIFVEQYVLHWMLHWHNWQMGQVISFTRSLRQHKNKHFEKKPRRFVIKPCFTFM